MIKNSYVPINITINRKKLIYWVEKIIFKEFS
jgi:hypothetical protein